MFYLRTIDISPCLIHLRRMRPLPRVKLRVSWRHGMNGNPEDGMKRGHRIKPAIEAKYILIQVGLQMFWLDATVMRPLDPSFQVAENKMDHGQVGFGLVRIAAERQRVMVVSNLWQFRIPSPSVSAHHSAKRNIVSDKADKRFGASIRHNTKSQPSRINSTLVLLAIVLARPNLNGADNDRFVVGATTFAARLAADQAFIDFDRILVADGVALRTNHTSAKLVEYLESSLVASERELTLKLDGRLPWHLRGHEVCAPKPRREWRVARLHDGSCRQRRIGLATTTTQHDRRARCEPIRLANNAALWTRKPICPADGFEIASASRIVGEHPLKLRKRSGKAANVHVLNNGTFSCLCQATG